MVCVCGCVSVCVSSPACKLDSPLCLRPRSEQVRARLLSVSLALAAYAVYLSMQKNGHRGDAGKDSMSGKHEALDHRSMSKEPCKYVRRALYKDNLFGKREALDLLLNFFQLQRKLVAGLEGIVKTVVTQHDHGHKHVI